MSNPVDPFEGIENDPAAPPPMMDPDPDAVDREVGFSPPQKPQAPAQEPAAHPVGSAAQPKPATLSEAQDVTRLVRIKPFNKKRRQLTRRYTVFGVKFEVERGWYRVKMAVAEYLSKVTTDGDPDSPLIFDVCTHDQALEMEERERRRAMELAGMGPYRASDPREMGDGGVARMRDSGALTTHDLRHGHDSRRRTANRE